jgi:hypothetical protein
MRLNAQFAAEQTYLLVYALEPVMPILSAFRRRDVEAATVVRNRKRKPGKSAVSH